MTYKSYYGSRVNLVADPGDVREYFGGEEGLQMKFQLFQMQFDPQTLPKQEQPLKTLIRDYKVEPDLNQQPVRIGQGTSFKELNALLFKYDLSFKQPSILFPGG